MAFKLRLRYPSGEEEVLDEEFGSESEAESEGMEQANAFAIGGEILELAGRDYEEGNLEYEVIEE